MKVKKPRPLQIFSANGGRSRMLYEQKVEKILDDFLATKDSAVANPIREASRLVPAMDAILQSPFATINPEILRQFARGLNRPGARLIAGILADRENILLAQTKVLSQQHLASNGGFFAKISREIWAQRPEFLSIEQIDEELLSQINLESILIESARTLQNIYDFRAAKNRGATYLKNVLWAEVTLAPTLDLMGFGGFSMALNSAALRARFENSGQGELLRRATAEFAKYGTHQDNITQVSRIFRELSDGDQREALDVIYSGTQRVGKLSRGRETANDSAHHILISSGHMSLNGMPIRYKWRRKSLGSLTQKMQSFAKKGPSEDSVPMDLYAGKIIVPDESNQGELFAELVQRIYDHSELSPAAAPGRDSAIQIWGSDNYRKQMIAALRMRGIREKIQEIPRSSMNLSKITFFAWKKYKMPFELQLVDESTHIAMLVGEASHINYKSGQVTTRAGLEAQQQIHDRRTRMSSVSLMATTREKADKLLKFIASQTKM